MPELNLRAITTLRDFSSSTTKKDTQKRERVRETIIIRKRKKRKTIKSELNCTHAIRDIKLQTKKNIYKSA